MAHRGGNGIIKYYLIQNKQEGEKKIYRIGMTSPTKNKNKNPTIVNGRLQPRYICNHIKCKWIKYTRR